MENKGAEGGFWKPGGGPRDIAGDASVNGQVATHEFYEEQGPRVGKTDWLMLEDYITLKVSREAVLANFSSRVSSCASFFPSLRCPILSSSSTSPSFRPPGSLEDAASGGPDRGLTSGFGDPWSRRVPVVP
ncbi:hypothetical protein NL676_019309 [Syzygium grande]|nr:hypothetical protein NL676_019309 [Syzygium grande]